nr:hypothetical protein [Aeoliella mucimassa]
MQEVGNVTIRQPTGPDLVFNPTEFVQDRFVVLRVTTYVVCRVNQPSVVGDIDVKPTSTAPFQQIAELLLCFKRNQVVSDLAGSFLSKCFAKGGSRSVVIQCLYWGTTNIMHQRAVFGYTVNVLALDGQVRWRGGCRGFG